ncbi:MAG: hypothetical protein M1510_11665 [Nitrospirae bacterium]|nr:hypothetical protein [Nitrospirota bacterium]
MSIGKEVFLLQARLAGLKKTRGEKVLRADSYISIIRDIIDPYGGDFAGFDMEKFMVIAKDFYSLWEETKTLDEQIARMERDLNG